jgi:hypothetical protein
MTELSKLHDLGLLNFCFSPDVNIKVDQMAGHVTHVQKIPNA